MDLLQEYKELYYKEIEHSERLNNKIGMCITLLTILGSAQVLLWTQFKTFEYHIYSIVYFVFPSDKSSVNSTDPSLSFLSFKADISNFTGSLFLLE